MIEMVVELVLAAILGSLLAIRHLQKIHSKRRAAARARAHPDAAFARSTYLKDGQTKLPPIL